MAIGVLELRHSGRDTKPVPNPDPWHGQQPPVYPPPGSVDIPAYNSVVPPAAAAGQPAGTGGGRQASRADMSSFFAEEDIYRMTPHVKVEYAEVFKEADGANSFDALAEFSGLVFKWTQLGVYRFFSLIPGVPLAFLWAIVFALVNFFTVFLIQPSFKLTFVVLRPIAMLFKAIVRSFLDPLFQSIGLVFSHIMGRFAFNFKGLPGQKPSRAAAIEEL
ncbi:caveolin-3-like [Patiria miniata]|uniref:Caveolin n=1 Tax=Patiria miniata TaxID=46514 RepID=A0A914AZZ1_PATMI|nr:caveolin-3-like [Patiria miniata]